MKTADEIFQELNQRHKFSAEGLEIHFKKWQWYVNGKPVEPDVMVDTVFEYLNSQRNAA